MDETDFLEKKVKNGKLAYQQKPKKAEAKNMIQQQNAEVVSKKREEQPVQQNGNGVHNLAADGFEMTAGRQKITKEQKKLRERIDSFDDHSSDSDGEIIIPRRKKQEAQVELMVTAKVDKKPSQQKVVEEPAPAVKKAPVKEKKQEPVKEQKAEPVKKQPSPQKSAPAPAPAAQAKKQKKEKA
jgi:hypothetical protein